MSLINQMLKDLDARRETDARSRLHREIRPLPKVSKRFSARAAGVLMLGLATAGAGAWYFFRVPTAVAPSVPAAPLIAAPSAPKSEDTAVITPPPPVAPVAESVTVMGGSEAVRYLPVLESPDGMKMSLALDNPPVAPVVATRADKVTADQRERPPAVGSARPPKAEAAPPKSTGHIEKQPSIEKGGREASEQEYRRAVGMVSGGRLEEATDLLLDVLRQDGGHVAARQLLARLLIEQRRTDEAYAILAEGVALKPAQTGWAMALARLQVEQGDLVGAGRTLQTSHPHALGNADYLGFAAHIQHRLGQQRAAAELYLSAARVAPGDGRWWFGLGLALEADQKPNNARDAFMRARATGSLPAELQPIVEQKLR